MEVDVEKGRYIVAVSGGVDSMVLLDILRKAPSLELIVAHFNHGIREDSAQDEKLAVETSRRLGLRVEVGHGDLDSDVSEDRARQARYDFLHSIRKKYDAKAIITAHHQDDLIETAILNLLRGTGRRGLTAIMDSEYVLRPLINVPKEAILSYAKDNKIVWREDSTNQDTRYLRNYIRKNILPSLTVKERHDFLKNIEKVAITRKELDNIIATISHKIVHKTEIDRSSFVNLPQVVAKELVMFWLRKLNVFQFDKKMVDRLYLSLKTAPAGTKHPVNKSLVLNISKEKAHFSLNSSKSLL